MMSASVVQAQTVPADGDVIDTHTMDSVEVSLLTCSPHEEIYSLYGHAAIRWHDQRNGTDLAFNWGMFNFKKPYFALRFVFGLTDYELGVVPYQYFLEEYRQCGSSVTEQVLDLTAEEKEAMYRALSENMQLSSEHRIILSVRFCGAYPHSSRRAAGAPAHRR